MCGISGIIGNEKNIDIEKYYTAHASMAHRGPDDEGFVSLIHNTFQSLSGHNTNKKIIEKNPMIFSQKNLEIILGHHRLSILDLSENGHQPFLLDKYAMVYNGEVYNYIELREELKKLGHAFYTDCDTEVVLKSFIEWGVTCFNRFNGMWAIALYNKDDDTLILCRDRYGVKPVYYDNSEGSLKFASEISFFKKLNKQPLNSFSSNLYLTGNRQDCGQETFYENIKQVLPAHYYVFQKDRLIKKARYWDFPTKKIKMSDSDALESFGELFRSSIDLRLRSNVPIGCLLSGGLDSTLIASVVSAGLPHQEINSYSAVYDNQQFSEEKYVNETVKRYPTLKSHLIKINPDSFLNEMDNFFKHQAGPVRSLAVYAQYKLYEYIANEKKVTVLLNGQGSDECWGGYNNHYTYFFLGQLLKGNISSLHREVELYCKNRNVASKSVYRGIATTLMSQMVPQGLKEKIKKIEQSNSSEKKIRQSTFNLDGKLKENITYSALKEYLGYEDRNSMAFGKESRLPFLDYRLVELAFSLDDHFKIDHFENKKLVRDFAKSYIPTMIHERKDKMGFVTPQEVWQRNELKDMMLSHIKLADDMIGENLQGIKKKTLDYFENRNNDWASAWRYFNYCYWIIKEN
jgi:asparagine synthase (glutamine-hydrolysing)